MSDLHFELTDETRVHESGVTLHCVRATRDLSEHGVKAGGLGGWVESAGNLTGRWAASESWVAGEACVYGDARVVGRALVGDHAAVYGNAHVSGCARVYSAAQIYGEARVGGNAYIAGSPHIAGDARVSGEAEIIGSARIGGGASVGGQSSVGGAAVLDKGAWVAGQAVIGAGAHLTSIQDVLTLGPVGSESVMVTLYRTRTGHVLKVGCWTGTINELADEVDLRAKGWDADREKRWRAEYAAVETLCAARAAGWDGAR